MKNIFTLLFLFFNPLLHATITHFKAPKNGVLSTKMIHHYHKYGFIILDNFLSINDCVMLKKEAHRIVAQCETNNMPIFTTDKNKHQQDTYFLKSGDRVRCFFEENVAQSNTPQHSKQIHVNKIGHALHDKNIIFRNISFSPSFVNLARSLQIEDPRIVQSMYIFKSPHIGGTVPPHQDATFLYTNPVSVVGFWMAIDDATKENACLWVIPQSHTIPISKRYIIHQDKTLTFKTIAQTSWPTNYVPLEVNKGTLIILHGQLIHQSEQNRSKKERNAYTMHIMSGKAKYAKNNWLQRNTFPALK